MANIRLNFLPIIEDEFPFLIYRKLFIEGVEKEDNTYIYQLPVDSNLNERNRYLVSFQSKEGYTEYQVYSFYAKGLTLHFLTYLLINKLATEHCVFPSRLHRSFAEEKIEFTIKEHKKGNQIIFLSPYYFEEQKRFGFIIDFKFIKNEEASFDKEVQMLSLSLDKAGKSNRNYYTDKHKLIEFFLSEAYNAIEEMIIDQTSTVHLGNSLIEVPVFQLNKKEYIFNHNNTSNSQFQGIRNYGPYQKITDQVIFVYIFESRHRSFANELFLSLTGKSNPGTFPGFEQMFGIHIGIENTRRIQIVGKSNTELLDILNEVKKIKEENSTKKTIGIYIEDYLSDSEDELASDNYYFLKYNFIKNDIPLQVINYNKLSERNSLKWSTSNIGLAMFAKLGGIPWVVKPSNDNCLILGIGSAHKRNHNTKEITKYFAYTICLDSSGLYKQLAVLADESSETTYLEEITKNLIRLLRENSFASYKTCVLHLPFKIKLKEMDAISKAIQQISNIEFVAIKVNLNNRYFGYSTHNTLVPYESSFIKLSRNEYLVWFEGLLYGKEVIDKRLSNPVHIQFLNIANKHGLDEKKYLQDVLNLSGANWRGFNAKAIPISIYYSQIIAKYTENFERIDGYEENKISNEKPWFL